MQNIIFILKFNIKMLNINVYINFIKVSNFFLNYSLNTILYILTQCVNSLTAVIII